MIAKASLRFCTGEMKRSCLRGVEGIMMYKVFKRRLRGKIVLQTAKQFFVLMRYNMCCHHHDTDK